MLGNSGTEGKDSAFSHGFCGRGGHGQEDQAQSGRLGVARRELGMAREAGNG